MFEDYAIEGEDLDWTKVTDPRERKRLQNIINGRKYRERRLAAEAAEAAARASLPGEPAPVGQNGAMTMGMGMGLTNGIDDTVGVGGGGGGYGEVQMSTSGEI